MYTRWVWNVLWICTYVQKLRAQISSHDASITRTHAMCGYRNASSAELQLRVRYENCIVLVIVPCTIYYTYAECIIRCVSNVCDVHCARHAYVQLCPFNVYVYTSSSSSSSVWSREKRDDSNNMSATSQTEQLISGLRLVGVLPQNTIQARHGPQRQPHNVNLRASAFIRLCLTFQTPANINWT